MTDSKQGDGGGLPRAGFRHDFASESGKRVRFHLLEAHLPENPRGEISELVRRKDALEDKLMTIKFALEAYDKDYRAALKQREEELLEELEK